jgi:tetratricopeptide (TPR) repeat protein
MPAAAASAAAPAPAKAAAPPIPTPVAHQDAASALSDIFDEFKEDAEATAGEAEDPDTHYNLGIAFKEMGLLDEAIGELQKVAKAIDQGHPFAQQMQAYTWLAQCLVDKGVPQAAVRWYERALKVNDINEESKLAVYYDLGNAYELAGNRQKAHDTFLEVYSANIDYRDVADRIKALKN